LHNGIETATGTAVSISTVAAAMSAATAAGRPGSYAPGGGPASNPSQPALLNVSA
jgi:hypothetical protein